MAVSRQRGKNRVSCCIINLDGRQSRGANDNAGIVMRAKEEIRYSGMLKKAQQEAK